MRLSALTTEGAFNNLVSMVAAINHTGWFSRPKIAPAVGAREGSARTHESD